MITQDGKLLKFRRDFNVPVAKLYEAWTDPNLLSKWINYIKIEEMDVREGGKYHWTFPRNPDDYLHGTYRAVLPNEKIVKTWDTAGTCNGKTGPVVSDTLVTLAFTPLSDSTSRLVLSHEFLPAERIDDHHWGWTGMMVDLDQMLNSPTREIDPALQVKVTKTFNFPVAKVFNAWTQPEMMNRWFNSRGHSHGKAHNELKVGGDFFMDYQMKDGEVFRLHGEYLEIEPNQRLRFTWVEDSPVNRVTIDSQFPSEVTVSFKDLGGTKTEVTVLHTKISSSAMMNNFNGGWSQCLASMEEELQRG